MKMCDFCAACRGRGTVHDHLLLAPATFDSDAKMRVPGRCGNSPRRGQHLHGGIDMADSTCRHDFARTDTGRWKCVRCGKSAKHPLPNGFLKRGDLCPKSFAGHPEDHLVPHPDAKGWGICGDCGAVLNLRFKTVPEHRIP